MPYLSLQFHSYSKWNLENLHEKNRVLSLSATAARSNSILDFWQSFSLNISQWVRCAAEESSWCFSAKHLKVEPWKKLSTRSMTCFLLFCAREQPGSWGLLSALELWAVTEVHRHPVTCCQQGTVWHGWDSQAELSGASRASALLQTAGRGAASTEQLLC